MLREYPLTPSLATADADRAKRWYHDKLGLDPIFEDAAAGYLRYQVGLGKFTVYRTSSAGTAQNTVAMFNVRDVDSEVDRLRARGVVFEDYDFGDYKTQDGILRDPSGGGNAWFKDPDGNILSVLSSPRDTRPETVSAMLAASDLDRAKAWYGEKLGFDQPASYVEGVLDYESGGGWFEVYMTDFAGTAKNTVGAWTVPDLDAEMAELRSRGVTFEEYDFGEMKTVDGVLTDPSGWRNAWFVDSEGNTLALVESEAGG